MLFVATRANPRDVAPEFSYVLAQLLTMRFVTCDIGGMLFKKRVLALQIRVLCPQPAMHIVERRFSGHGFTFVLSGRPRMD